jgi:hypothetical protein
VGILADLFVATRDDALRYEEAQDSPEFEPERYEIAQYGGVTSLEFGTLWAILEGAPWNVERHMLTNLAHGEGGETWLDEFPAEYVALLAASDEASLVSAADAWGNIDELQCSGPPPHDFLGHALEGS